MGDESRRPDNCIDSWRELHPDWQFKIWGNEERAAKQWRNEQHMQGFEANGQLCGVADLMRWEILEEHGGVALDADAICLSSVPDWLLKCSLFACYENELAAPGLVSNGFVGTQPANPLVSELVNYLHNRKDVTDRFVWYALRRKRQRAWKTSGPRALTQALRRNDYNDATLLPSHFMLPLHYSGRVYRGGGPIIGCQLFGSTRGSQYGELHLSSTAELRQRCLDQLGTLA